MTKFMNTTTATQRGASPHDASQFRSYRLLVSILLALFIMAAGLTAALYIIGPRAINPWNTDWLIGDPSTHYMGWAFLRKTPTWYVPWTWTDRLGYPWGVSISFLDSIPLVAVLLRPLSPLLGEPFQYIGLYATLSIILQAFFGFLLARRIGLSSFVSAGLTGIFFMLAPAFLWRFHGHFALATHWLILAALYCYLRSLGDRTPASWLAPLWMVTAIGGSINPYIGVMCLWVALAGCGRLWLTGRVRVLGLIGSALFSVVVLMISFVVFGFVVGGDTSSYAGGGYRSYSMNLLSPLDPHVYHGLLYAALPMANPGQYEGYNYLGLGILALLGAGLIFRTIRVADLLTKDTFPLLVVGLLSTLAAASATITIGPVILASIPLPPSIEAAAQMLRASGRLFWPAYYLLVLAALASLRKVRPRAAEAILALALAIQIADIMPLMGSVRAATHDKVEEKLVSPAWNTLGEHHLHLVVHPAWQCNIQETPDGTAGFTTFGMLADRQRMTTNSYYTGRVGQTDLQRHCDEALAPVLAGDLDPDTAYVLSDKILNDVAATSNRTHRCTLVDGFNLCVHDPDDPGMFTPPGSWIDFSSLGMASSYLREGWSGAEPWGRWSEEAEAAIVIPANISHPRYLEIDSQAFVTEGAPSQIIHVSVNGQRVRSLEFTTEKPIQINKIPLPKGTAPSGDRINIRFRIEAPRSPQDVGLSSDDRKLGIGIRRLRLTGET